MKFASLFTGLQHLMLQSSCWIFFQKKKTHFAESAKITELKRLLVGFLLNILVSFLFRGPKVGSQNIALIFALH